MVSVIIPTYKRPQLVLRAVQSVLGQTYKDLEVIVMDDSRDDLTAVAIRSIGDPRVRYIHNVEQLRLAGNRNEGVRSANKESKYIAFLDDDDEYLPEFLARTIATLEKDSELMIVSTDSELRRFDGTFLRRYPCERETFWRVAFGGGAVMRRAVFDKFNIWYDRNILFEDLDFGVRVASAHKWGGIPEALRIYYGYPEQKGDSLSTANMQMPREKLEGFWKKNQAIYVAAGSEAVAWAKLLTGKWLMRSGQPKAGREYIWGSLRARFTLSAFGFYMVALFSPGAFTSMRLMVAKNKIKGFLGK